MMKHKVLLLIIALALSIVNVNAQFFDNSWYEMYKEEGRVRIWSVDDVHKLRLITHRGGVRSVDIEAFDSILIFKHEIKEFLKSCYKLSDIGINSFSRIDATEEDILELLFSVNAKQIKTISLTVNKLTNVPSGIKRFRNLQRLDLMWNDIKDMENLLKRLKFNKNLKDLWISSNPIDSLPSDAKLYGAIKGFYFSNTNVKELPCTILSKSQIILLGFKSTQIKEFPECLKDIDRSLGFDFDRDFLLNNCKEIEQMRTKHKFFLDRDFKCEELGIDR